MKKQTHFYITDFSKSPFCYSPHYNKERRVHMNKHYYTCIRTLDGLPVTHIWHCTQQVMFTQVMPAYDFVIALDRKPRNATNILEG